MTDAAAYTDARPSGLRLLSDAQLAEIHGASLAILRRTGVRVYEEESLQLLHGAGCHIDDGTRVRFPAAVVEDALRAAPSRVVLSQRDGTPALFLEGRHSYFGTGSDLPYTRDLESGERRPSLLADVEQVARLVDALPQLDFVMSMALPSDVPSATSDRRSFRAMVANTSKPVVFTAWDEGGLADIVAMAAAVAGGAEALQRSPFLLAYLEPTSPLQHTAEVLRKLLLMADRGLPFVYAPGPVEGATAPVTPAGSLAMANAEVLSGLVITQLRRPGTPFVWGSGSGPMDMLTTTATYAGPEFMLHCLAMAELAHVYYGLPVWGFAGCSDSKLPDMQAGIESALWILWAALSGTNLVHDVGYIESGLTCSYEMIVIGDEIISFVRRLLGGMRITPETLALDVIDAVGPGGDFLGTDHTLDHYRDVWYPRLFDRRMVEGWQEAGRPTALERARAMARETIASQRPAALPPEVSAQLQSIIDDADARAGVAASNQ
jgi:trimethylamine---corrinoid protein Co-methyltransferase